jgi:hypothetical protein
MDVSASRNTRSTKPIVIRRKDQFQIQPRPLSYHTRSHRDPIPQGLRYYHPPNTLGSLPSANHVPLPYHPPYPYPLYSTPTPTYMGPATPANPDNISHYQSSLKPSESNELSAKKDPIERDHAFYDILEATMLCISDGQILLSLAFSMSFMATDNRCTTSQYHFKVGLNLWLNATTSAVLSFAMVRHYFRSFLSGIFRLVALIGSLIFSLGLPLMLQVNSGFASEITPSDHRGSSQIFLNALCFMDPSFRRVVVDDQINNQAVIGNCLTHPELSQEFVSWAVTCIIWAIIMLGRFGRRATRPFREETDPSPDPDSKSRAVLMFWLFLMLVWCFAVGVFSYRTFWILNLRRWVASSPWIEDPSAETHVRTFGQFAALFSMASILLAALDQNVSRTEDEKEE